MTREQWSKLTPEEQRIKVAELCGLTIQKQANGKGYFCWSEERNRKLAELDVEGKETHDDGMLAFPDYLNDLNAMHEAEKLLTTAKESNSYWGALLGICNNTGEPTWSIKCHYAHATAAQRCEAFVLTMTGSQ